MKRGALWSALNVMVIFTVSLLVMAGTKQDDIAEIKSLEIQSWEAWKRQDLAAIKRLSAPDYLSSDGESVTDMAEEERYVPLTVLKDYKILDEMRTLRVSSDVFIVFFPIQIEATEAGKNISGRLAIASVWVKRDGKWRNVFVHEVPMKTARP